jgi:hypothetical protein
MTHFGRQKYFLLTLDKAAKNKLIFDGLDWAAEIKM